MNCFSLHPAPPFPWNPRAVGCVFSWTRWCPALRSLASSCLCHCTVNSSRLSALVFLLQPPQPYAFAERPGSMSTYTKSQDSVTCTSGQCLALERFVFPKMLSRYHHIPPAPAAVRQQRRSTDCKSQVKETKAVVT